MSIDISDIMSLNARLPLSDPFTEGLVETIEDDDFSYVVDEP
jgi:hypothetical protein